MRERDIKILVIDDEESIRDSIRWHLEDLGYTVITAGDPQLCPAYHHRDCDKTERCADVVFIDYNMPTMNGLEFLLAQAERNCKLPPRFKMVMTGASTENIEKECAALGCALAQKPVPLSTIEAFVRRAKDAIEAGELP